MLVLVICVFFVALFITGCVTTGGKNVTVEQIKDAVVKKEGVESPYKAIGFFKFRKNLTQLETKRIIHPNIIIANSEVGKEYIRIAKKFKKRNNSRYNNFIFEPTEKAISEGAFVEGDYIFVPIGQVSYKITEQRLLDYKSSGQQLNVYTNFNVNMNVLGNYIKDLFSKSEYKAFRRRLLSNGKMTLPFKRNNPNDPWEFGSLS